MLRITARLARYPHETIAASHIKVYGYVLLGFKGYKVEEIITLTIDKLAGLGDGAGEYEDHKVFVPYTLAGDVVRARIHKRTTDANYATLETLLTPGKDRIKPVCRHFTQCGGCQLQHVGQGSYAKFKQEMAEAAVRKAGFDASVVKPLRIMQVASRRRVDLKVKNGKVGYYKERSHQITNIEECKVLEPKLFALVLELKKQIALWSHVTAIQINTVDGGYDAVLESKEPDAIQMRSLASVKRLSVRNGSALHTVFASGPVTVTLGDVVVEVPPGAFLQAVAEAQNLIAGLVKEYVGPAKHVLDLFAGIGTYSFPLGPQMQVTAIEGNAAMVNAMRAAAQKLGKNFTAEERDLFYNPVSAEILAGFDAVIINPPRAGAKAQCEQLAQVKVPTLVMVSCNPATFARDARILKEGGYTLKSLTPIDQFIYSPHLECVAEFVS